jgi:cellulose synthase/poly-beta-1,6-N-acetylglucosamine synthase-like glycosyltransferase
VARALGGVVLFTDDDCRPRRDWAERLTAAVSDGIDVVAGRTVAFRPGAVAAAWEVVADAPNGAAPALAFAPTNNIACRAEVARAVPFDPRYRSPAGEDRDWCAQVVRSGYTFVREPSAVVEHDHVQSVVAFFRQQVRYGRGAYTFRYGGGQRRPLESPRFYADLVRRAFRRSPAVGALVAVAQVATAVGFASELLSPRARRR